ncbi:MAG: hypothetical protein NTY53_06280 [Kiritimatiellaeota bacterium]|nr:hypothetical protein [Kiritimatiellota bacterium]
MNEPQAETPLPPSLPVAGEAAHEYRPPDPARDPAWLLDRLLKRPGVVAWELCAQQARTHGGLFLILALALLGYGLLVGAFSGGQQYVLVPLKLLGGVLVSAVLCLPSLYILSCLSGGRLALAQISALMLQALTLTVVLLAGFAPVAWVFAQSTHSTAFMSGLHWVFWFSAFGLGMGQLKKLLARHHENRLSGFVMWSAMLLVVMLQMGTVLRPLVGPSDGWRVQDKQFFLEHWGQTLKDAADRK